MTAADWQPSCVIETLHARAQVLGSVRAFFAERGVLEVNTPVLAARTVLDPAIESMRVGGRYLQTSPEYHMKRLLAAGAPSIYQLGPVFRAEEAGRWHNPEFLMLEWYRLGFDAEALMAEVEELVDALLGEAPYRRVAYRDLIAGRHGLDIDTADDAVLARACAEIGLEGEAPSERSASLDLLTATAIEEFRDGRVFVTEYPPDQAALARVVESGGRTHAARFELVVGGVEIANGYHELLDPVVLEERMARDAAVRRSRDLPLVEPDERLIEAQRQGLPECAGVALGLDRLVALKLDLDGIAPALTFEWNRA